VENRQALVDDYTGSARSEDAPNVIATRPRCLVAADDVAGIPREWADGLSRLRKGAPIAGVTVHDRLQLIEDADRFLPEWGNEAARRPKTCSGYILRRQPHAMMQKGSCS
jgi:hypothetical protein